MVKCRIHIRGGACFKNDVVFVDIELQSVPSVGEYLSLGDKQDDLEKLANSSVKIAEDYVNWTYTDDYVCFDDAGYISMVYHSPYKPYTRIVLSDGQD